MKWNQFVNSDCFSLMREIEDNSVDLVFTSPPDISQTEFNKDITLYKNFQNKMIDEFSRITKESGFVAIAQTDRKINAEVLANHVTYCVRMTMNGWKLKDHKIIVRNQPADKKDMYYFNYQHCLIFTKTGTIKRSGDFLKNILIYETQKIKEFTGPLNFYVWNSDFVRLMIERLTEQNEKILDPFAGSGIALFIAKALNRNYLGCELDKDVYNTRRANEKMAI